MDGPALRCSAAAFAAGALTGFAFAGWRRRAAERAEAPGEKAVAAMEPQQDLQCSMCKKWVPPAGFIARQARRPANKRKCSACVDGFHGANAAAEQPPAVATQESGRSLSQRTNRHVSHERRRNPPDDKAAPDAAPAVEDAAPAVEAQQQDDAPAQDTIGDPLRLARKAETVLRARTARVALVLENCCDDMNHVAILRTCEALGVLRVFLVEALPAAAGAGAGSSRASKRLAARAAQRGFGFDPVLGVKRAQLYCEHLDVRTFPDVPACLAALAAEGYHELWATDLAQEAVPLTADRDALAAVLPERVAVVLGSEGAGVSAAMLAAATRRVFLPMYGFTESFNVSVAAALVLSRLLDACDAHDRGSLPAAELAALRRTWYDGLARSEAQRAEFRRLADAGGAAPFADTRRPQAHRAERARFSRDPKLVSTLVDGAGAQISSVTEGH